ncbi:MAG: hypothetical protein KC457_05440 [Myxococcales bacterium]|nr:hypothetical protein [Myxococcales bacterium]
MLACLTVACGDDKAEAGEAGTEGAAAEAGEAAEGDGGSEAQPEAQPKAGPSPVTGADRFKHWSPRHAFINTPVILGDVISSSEAIVATAGGHVGVTTDGGASWRWTKIGDRVIDVTGYAGGPYAILHEDAVALSDDGLRWRRAPRRVDDKLIDVVAAKVGLVAIGKNGGWVRFDKDGIGGSEGWLPDKFKPKAVTELNGAVLAWAGKKGYGTTDGSSWTELEALPVLGDGRSFLTSAGSCTIGKVGSSKGVVCNVSGNAFGIGGEFAVENKGVVSLTRDGGKTWVTAALPAGFKNVSSIFGQAGGPYYAIGGSGVAMSKDGKTWVDQKWQESGGLADGVMAGGKIVMVGAKGTLIYSKDSGTTWDFATAPAGKNFNWVGSVGGSFVASDGKVFLSSSDGIEWVETEAFELPGKPGDCEDAPDDGESCRFNAAVTSPEGLPLVRALNFEGDVGLAMGDDGLVAISRDGGVSWAATSGLAMGKGGVIAFDFHGEMMAVTNGARLLSSHDGGDTWVEGEFVGKPRFNAVLVSSKGQRLAGGKNELLASEGESRVWLPVSADLPAGNWIALHEAGAALYAADSGGKLLRSEDGKAWSLVVTGISRPVIDMAGEGEVVWAQVLGPRYERTSLMRSEDGGRHFIFVGEAPGYGRLQVEGGVASLGGERSDDGGQSWSVIDDYHPGEPVGDGSTLNVISRYKADDQLYLYSGSGDDTQRLQIVSAALRGGNLECEDGAGCWLLAGGVLYRPLGQ